MRRIISVLGVPEPGIVLDECSRNATQNADLNKDIGAREGVIPPVIGRFLLVTSASNLSQAKALFEAQGEDAITATVQEIRAYRARVSYVEKVV